MQSIALYGLGVWGAGQWVPALLDAAGSSQATVSLVDLTTEPPPTMADRIDDWGIRYHKFEESTSIRQLDGAIVCTPAQAHAEVVRSLTTRPSPPRWILCEKPGGDSRDALAEILDLCNRAEVDIGFVDHYLLKPDVRAFLRGSSLNRVIAGTRSVSFLMLETQAAGPPGECANVVMGVHGFALMHALFPAAEAVIEASHFGQAAVDAYAPVTYALMSGHLRDGGMTLCTWTIEVGKQMRSDRKALEIDSSEGRLLFRLGSTEPWSYGISLRYILSSGSMPQTPSEAATLGIVLPPLMDRVWSELESAAALGSEDIATYDPGALP